MIESLLDAERRQRVEALEAAVTEWRRDRGRDPLSPSALSELPEGPAVAGDLEWRLRRHDLALVRSLLRERGALRVLDFGAWNGWLSRRLTDDSHEVTAVDAFAGPWSLAAPWPFEPGWRRVQAELPDLAGWEGRFDIVIANRCLTFQPDPAAAVAALRGLVAAGGSLIATGLLVYRDAGPADERLAVEVRAFRERFGMELLMHPTRGVLDRSDLERFALAGLATSPVPGLRSANLRALFDRRRPEHRYGVARGAGPL